VIGTFPVDQPIGIVHPCRWRHKMISGAVWIRGGHMLKGLLPFYNLWICTASTRPCLA